MFKKLVYRLFEKEILHIAEQQVDFLWRSKIRGVCRRDIKAGEEVTNENVCFRIHAGMGLKMLMNRVYGSN